MFTLTTTPTTYYYPPSTSTLPLQVPAYYMPYNPLKVCDHILVTMYATLWTQERTLLSPLLKCCRCGALFEKDTSVRPEGIVNVRLGKHQLKFRKITARRGSKLYPLKKKDIEGQFQPLEYY